MDSWKILLRGVKHFVTRVRAKCARPVNNRRKTGSVARKQSAPFREISPTLAELLMPLPAANPFSTMRASLRWYSSEELEDGVTYGGQSWLRRGSVDSFFSALLLRDGDAAGRRKRSSS